MSWGNWYWPAWLFAAFSAFIGPEVYALLTGNPQNTLSWWVWARLNIARDESPGQWTALDFLTFGVWLVIVAWLTFHFWFGRFR